MRECGLSHNFAAPFHARLPYHCQAICAPFECATSMYLLLWCDQHLGRNSEAYSAADIQDDQPGRYAALPHIMRVARPKRFEAVNSAPGREARTIQAPGERIRPVRATLVFSISVACSCAASFAVPQNVAHAVIMRRRRSNKSPRRYACSTLLLTVCASAISA